MIDCQSITASFFTAAAAAPSTTHAARALDPLVAALRSRLEAPAAPDAPPPMLRLVDDGMLARARTESQVANRLRLRLDQIELAKRFGDAIDVQRMVSLTIDEVQSAALAARK